MRSPLRFYNPLTPIGKGDNRLPHWHQQEATYFLTFRLADAVPAEPMRAYVKERDAWLAAQPPRPWPSEVEKEYSRKFSGRFERWLDRGHGTCLLRDRQNARIVADALCHFEGERSRLHAWVIMPNHVHALASPMGNETLSTLLQSWKGYTAKRLNERRGASGPVWQKSYFDRMIRDWDHFAKCVRYIRDNPSKANLKPGEYLRDESDLARRCA